MELQKYKIAHFYQRYRKISRKLYEYRCGDKLFASGYIRLLFYKPALFWYITQKLAMNIQ